MNLRKLFKRETKLYAPVNGVAVPLDMVKDNVFSKRMLGDGLAFEFDGDTVFSPCKGKVCVIAKSKHAFGISMDDGTEVLLHVGLDTVNLNGCGLTVLVKKGDQIKNKDPILKIDREFMSKNNIDMTVILIVTNKKSEEIRINNCLGVDLDTEVIAVL